LAPALVRPLFERRPKIVEGLIQLREADARVNGIVPLWTAAQLKKQAQQP
jgi:hypothetical protein